MKTHPKQFICIFIILLTVLVSVINFSILADTLTGKPIPLDKTPKWPYIVEKEPGYFKLLIVTDLHLGAFFNKQTVKDIARMVKNFSPEMLIITGDVWCDNSNHFGQILLELTCSAMKRLGFPWAFVWGNHDELDDYNKGHAILENAPNSLYRGSETDGNYRIELREKEDGATVWNFIIINDSRNGMKQDQLEWFKAEVHRIERESPVPPLAFIFMHIPIREYDDVVIESVASGIKFEKNCPEGSIENALQVFEESKMVKAMFCGHDHVNDYYGIKNGIRLQYVRSSGYLGYGRDKVRKGGTLVNINTKNGTFETMSVFPDGTTWTPKGFITKPEVDRIY